MRALLVLLLTSAACLNTRAPSAEPVPTAPTVVTQGAEAPVVLHVGESVAIPGSSDRIVFVGVSNDSRCPKGTTCVWEGDAVVELRIEAAGAEAGHLELHVNPRFAQQGTAHGVNVALERLDPYPEADAPVPASAYVATLHMTGP